jgi:hypothetical protein
LVGGLGVVVVGGGGVALGELGDRQGSMCDAARYDRFGTAEKESLAHGMEAKKYRGEGTAMTRCLKARSGEQ